MSLVRDDADRQDQASMQEDAQLLCCVCGHVLSEPLLLNCLHSCCKSCLPDPTGATGSCPLCKDLARPAQVPMRNFFLEKRLPSLGTASESAACDACKKDGRQVDVSAASWRCRQCSTALCDGCLKWHGTFLPQHVVEASERQQQQQQQLLLPSIVPATTAAATTAVAIACLEHAGTAYEFFCHGCKSLKCSRCLKHCLTAKHSVEPLDDGAAAGGSSHASIDDHVRRLTESIASCEGSLRGRLLEVSARAQLLTDLDAALAAQLLELASEKRRLVDAVSKAHDDAEEALHRCYAEIAADSGGGRAAEESVAAAKRLAGRLGQALAYSECVRRSGDVSSFVHQQRAVHSRLQELLAEEPPPPSIDARSCVIVDRDEGAGDQMDALLRRIIGRVRLRADAKTMTSKGTLLAFKACRGEDIAMKNGCNVTVTTDHQCLTAMPAYAAQSLEELRLENYGQHRLGEKSPFDPQTSTSQAVKFSSTNSSSKPVLQSKAPLSRDKSSARRQMSSLPASNGFPFGSQSPAVHGQSATSPFGGQLAAAAPMFGDSSTGTQAPSAPDSIFGGSSRGTGSASTGGFTFGFSKSLTERHGGQLVPSFGGQLAAAVPPAGAQNVLSGAPLMATATLSSAAATMQLPVFGTQSCATHGQKLLFGTSRKPLFGLSEQFKPAAGTWECSGCFIRNVPASFKCLACGASKPGGIAAPPITSGQLAAGQPANVSSPLASLLSANSEAPKVGSNGGTPSTATATVRSLFPAAAAAHEPPALPSSLGTASGAGSKAPANVLLAGWAMGMKATGTAQMPPFHVALPALSTGGGGAPAAASIGSPVAGLSAAPPIATTTTMIALKPAIIGSSGASAAVAQQKSLFGGTAGSTPLFGAQKPSFGAAPVAPAASVASTATTAQPPVFGTQSGATAGQKSLFGTPLLSSAPVTTGAVAGTTSSAPVASGPSSSSVTGVGSKLQSGAPALLQAPSSTLAPKPSSGGPPSGSIIGQLLVKPPAAGEAESSKAGSESNAAKPSVFQGFSFNLQNQVSPFFQTKQPVDSAKPFLFGGGLLQKVTVDRAEPQQSHSLLQPLVGSTGSDASQQQQQRSRAISEGEKSDGNVSVEEYEPQVDFKPIIPLPDLVEVKTGEEDEEALFAERARLYRFDKAASQWKERGIGVLKILRSVDRQQYRLVMRRDQVLKLCANHLLAVDTELKPMQGNAKAWCWFASDFSEGSVSNEQLSARFGSQETAERFRSVVADCCENLKAGPTHKPGAASTCDGNKQPPVDADAVATVDGKSAAVNDKPAPQPSLAELFKPSEGTWSCETCLASNDGKTQRCPCCQTLKPGATESVQPNPGQGQTVSSLPASTAFRFGSQSSVVPGHSVAPLLGGQSAPLFGSQSAPLFGGQSAAAAPLFGGSSTGTQALSAPANDFIFGGSRGTGSASTGGFTFGLAKSLTPDLYVNESGEDDHISFTPVVQLPECVEVETGEESEELLSMHRAKLFRFFNGEWKERGIGDVKLLKHRQSKRVRIIMRRDQILKLCLNHYVGPSLELTAMAGSNGKAFVWSAMDFADEEGSMQQFALRFKDAETAAAFKQAFEDARQSRHAEMSPVSASTPNAPHVAATAASTPAAARDTPTTSSFTSTPASVKAAAAAVFGSPRLQSPSSSVFGSGALGSSSPLACLPDRRIADCRDEGEVIFASEEKPTVDQLQRARQWQLPDAFYLYECNREPCPGCAGCEDREEAYLDRLFRGIHESDSKAPQAASADTSSAKASPAHHRASSGPEEARSVNEVVKESGGGDDMSNTMFSNQATSLSFSALASAAATGATSSFGGTSSGPVGVGRGKTWSGAGSSLFSSQNKHASKGSDVGGAKDEHNEEGDDNPEHSSDDIFFKPVLEKLPDLIEVKTGEESEVVEFCQRCKLYRFDAPSGQNTAASSSQWKERGVGEIKLLRHLSTGAVRVVMRRDQVLKLACNHRLTADIELCHLATSEQAWCWQAMDFSENTLKSERFAARFKTIALANEFKQAFERCKATLGVISGEARPASDLAQDNLVPCQVDEAELQALVSESHDRQRSSPARDVATGKVLFEKRCTATEHKDGAEEPLGMGTITIAQEATVDQHFSVTMVNGDNECVLRGIVARGCSLESGPKKASRYVVVSSPSDKEANATEVSRKIQLDFSSTAAAGELDDVFKPVTKGS